MAPAALSLNASTLSVEEPHATMRGVVATTAAIAFSFLYLKKTLYIAWVKLDLTKFVP